MAQVKRTHPRKQYSERPFRLYNPKTKKNWPRRCYATLLAAEDKAIVLAKNELRVSEIIEIYNVHKGQLNSFFKRSATGHIQYQSIRKG